MPTICKIKRKVLPLQSVYYPSLWVVITGYKCLSLFRLASFKSSVDLW